MAARGIQLTHAAETDLASIVDYLLSRSRPAAEAFAEAYFKAVETIRTFPEVGKPLAGQHRRLLFERASYGLLYRFADNDVTIVAVGHASRGPGFWNKRMR